ncbi:ribosome biogenesis factor YjgA [Gallibacterium trehalosifermentans]|uniref:Dual-action ribosomal maturation protein DarP n=1 Tax=Gallibacterium trehalosifermentans TaxID=516935 RepID=A0ABV6GXR9_9PAST
MRFKDKEFEWKEEEEEEIIWVSKSEIKRDAEQLKQLGQKIVELSDNALAQIPLDEQLADAIQLARRLSRESYRRQMQFIGKLLRQRDIEPIQSALDKIENKHNQQQLLLHKIEAYREALLANGDQTITELLQDYPTLERQKLRALIRNAQKEKEKNSPPKAYREIYQYLKEHILDT